MYKLFTVRIQYEQMGPFIQKYFIYMFSYVCVCVCVCEKIKMQPLEIKYSHAFAKIGRFEANTP